MRSRSESVPARRAVIVIAQYFDRRLGGGWLRCMHWLTHHHQSFSSELSQFHNFPRRIKACRSQHYFRQNRPTVEGNLHVGDLERGRRLQRPAGENLSYPNRTPSQCQTAGLGKINAKFLSLCENIFTHKEEITFYSSARICRYMRMTCM